MGKLPYLQFYPGDWYRESGLSSCHIAARGIWIELLLSMHDATPRGVISTTLEALGTRFSLPATVEDSLDDCGAITLSAEQLIKQLANHSVCDLEFDSDKSRDSFWGDSPHCWFKIINRRMYREYLERQSLSAARTIAGSIGGRNSASSKAQAKLKQKSSKAQAKDLEISHTYQANDKQDQASSYSSSYSSSDSTKSPVPKDSLTFVEKVEVKAVKSSNIRIEDITFPPHLDTPIGRAAMADWLEHKLERRQSYKNMRGITSIFNQFKDLTDADLRASVDNCIGSNYSGLFPRQATRIVNLDRPLTVAQKSQEVLNRRLAKLRGNHDRRTDDSIIDVSGEVLEQPSNRR